MQPLPSRRDGEYPMLSLDAGDPDDVRFFRDVAPDAHRRPSADGDAFEAFWSAMIYGAGFFRFLA